MLEIGREGLLEYDSNTLYFFYIVVGGTAVCIMLKIILSRWSALGGAEQEADRVRQEVGGCHGHHDHDQGVGGCHGHHDNGNALDEANGFFLINYHG